MDDTREHPAPGSLAGPADHDLDRLHAAPDPTRSVPGLAASFDAGLG